MRARHYPFSVILCMPIEGRGPLGLVLGGRDQTMQKGYGLGSQLVKCERLALMQNTVETTQVFKRVCNRCNNAPMGGARSLAGMY